MSDPGVRAGGRGRRSILLAKLQASDTADVAAAARDTYKSSHNANAAKQAAIEAAHQRRSGHASIEVRIRPNGSVVVTVRKRASTIFLRHIGFLKRFAVVTATSTASP